MKVSNTIKYLFVLTILVFSSFSIISQNTFFLVDVSGSIDGMSKDRSIQSFDKISSELLSFLNTHKKDSIRILTYTDRIIDSFSLPPTPEDIESITKKISYPHKGNTDLNNALKHLDVSDTWRIIIVSDGKHNIGSNSQIINKLTSKKNRQQYFLLLDESDLETPLVKEFNNSNYIKVIRSLSELTDYELSGAEQDSLNNPQTTIVQTDNKVTNQIVEKKENKENIDFFNILFWLIMIIILLCLYCIINFLIPILPLFTMASAGAIQTAIAYLYNLPKPIYNIIFKALPNKMINFLQEYMPKYDNIKRGEVVPKNDVQKQTLEEWEKQAGKKAQYKNGEIDYSYVAKHSEKLEGTLDDYIPKSSNPRSKISQAQDRAAHQMLKSKIGREKIGKYVGKEPKDVVYEDYTRWKDDALNKDTPSHNPLTPHETIDGKEIMWVPKKYHDVAWGGIDHTGGVSMLKSIRNYFDLNT